MAVTAPVQYNPLGPNSGQITPAEGVARVQASPNDFGAQTGESLQKLGATTGAAADQWGSLISETQSNQAELDYIKSQGDLKAKYSQYEGLQADAMRPKYEADSIALQAKYRESLSPSAARMFDAGTRRTLASDISEYSGYAASQVKQANKNSFESLTNVAIDRTGDPGFVSNPEKFGSGMGQIVHAQNSIADITGLSYQSTGSDPKTGMLKFADTPEGNAANARYTQMVDDAKSKYVMGAVKTITNTKGSAAAADWLQQHADIIPDKAKSETNQYLAPKLVNENISKSIEGQTAELDAGWQKNFIANDPSLAKADGTKTDSSQPDVLGVIRKNEGVGLTKDNVGDVINGINSEKHPKEFAEAKELLQTKGQDAVNKYSDNFYQKNIIDKYDIGKLPTNTQSIVADGLVNHGDGAFGQSLISAAKDGATPQELIDMRRDEYSRLAKADTDKYGKYLPTWNKRLDDLQAGAQEGQQQGAQSSSVYTNKADYLRANADSYVSGVVEKVTQQYPDDYNKIRTAQVRAQNTINRDISLEDKKLKSDRDSLVNGIGGALTKNSPPMTQSDLAAIPGMQTVLDRVAHEQPKFYGDIDNMIAKTAHGNTSANTNNGYDTILRTLLPEDDKNGIHSEDHLAQHLGSDNPAMSISYKDYNDAKQSIGQDQTFKDFLHGNMQKISEANGNTDGQGQQRAIEWYNNTMKSWKQNQSLGEKAVPETQFIANVGEKDGPPMPAPPSRMQQIANVAKQLNINDGAVKQEIPTFGATDDPDFLALGKGKQFKTPDGKTWNKK